MKILKNNLAQKKRRKRKEIDWSSIVRKPREKKIKGELFSNIQFIVTGYSNENTTNWETFDSKLFYIEI